MPSRVSRVTWTGVVLVGALLGQAVPNAGAQQAAGVGTVEGTVRDNGTNRPIEGAQVLIAGTQIGTQTNAAGAFRLANVPARDVVVRVRFVGYAPAVKTVTVAPGQTARVELQIAQSALELDKVVTTGTGGQTEVKRLGNTIATIEPPKDAPINSPSELLQGREPGLVGLPSGGVTGEGARIRIRGNASLSQSNEPVIFVDGIRVNSSGDYSNDVGTGGGGNPSRLDDIDPSSIERIEVLKGAAAATLYGTEASNGVIQIFTKRGAAGAARWDFSGTEEAIRYPTDRLEPNWGYAGRLGDSPTTAQARADSLNKFWGRRDITPYVPFNEPLVARLFDTGRATTLAGSLSGGSTGLTYFLSGRYYLEDGPFTTKRLNMPAAFEATVGRVKRAQSSLNITALPTTALKVGARASYTNVQQDAPQNNNNIYSPITQTIFAHPELANCRASDPTGTDPNLGVASPGHCTGPGNEQGVQGRFGTPRELSLILTKQNVDRLIGALDATYTPVTDLSFTGSFGVDYTGSRNENFQPFGYNVDLVTGNTPLGSKTTEDRNDREITLDVKSNWTHEFGQTATSAFVVGGQGFISKITQPGGYNQDFPGPGISVASAGDQPQVFDAVLETVNGGYFAQEQLGLHNWVFLTGGARYDYSSAFGQNAGGVLYPKASISLVPSDLPGWSGRGGLSTLRLRAAYGKSGRQPGAFDKLTTFQAINGATGSGLAPANLGNPDLKPEVSTEAEAGAEVGLAENRLGLDVTFWRRRVADLLVEKQFPLSGGFQNRQLANIGVMKASGTELSLKAFLVNRPGISFDVFANGAYLRQIVASLGGAAPLKVGGSYPRYRNFITEGYAPGELFGAALLHTCRSGETANCVPAGSLAYDYSKIDPTGTTPAGTPATEAQMLAYLSRPRSLSNLFNNRIILLDKGLNSDLGKPTPDWSGAWGGNLTLAERWRIATLFEYRGGHYTYTCLTCAFRQASVRGRNIYASAQAGATLASPSATPQQRLVAAKQWLSLAALSPYDGLNQNAPGDFVRWRELSITYTAASDLAARLGAHDLALSFTARNLVLWTRYPGVDPEVNAIGRQQGGGRDATFLDAVDAFGPPLARRFGVAIRLGY